MISVSLGQESEHSLAGPQAQGPSQAAIKMSAGAESSGEGCASKLTHMVIGKVHFLARYWSEAVFSSLLLGPLQYAACFIEVSKPKKARK